MKGAGLRSKRRSHAPLFVVHLRPKEKIGLQAVDLGPLALIKNNEAEVIVWIGRELVPYGHGLNGRY